MQRKRNTGWFRRNWHYVAFSVSIIIGVVLGFLYEDKQPDDGNSFIVDNHPTVLKDTVVVHDTVFKWRTRVKWKYKRTCCCCCRQNYGKGGAGTQQDSIR